LRIWSSSESLRYLLLKLPSFLWRLLYSRAWLSESSAPLLHPPKIWTKRALDVLWNPCHSDAFWSILKMLLFQPLTGCWCQKDLKSRSLNIALSAFVGRSEANGIYQRVIVFMNLFEFKTEIFPSISCVIQREDIEAAFFNSFHFSRLRMWNQWWWSIALPKHYALQDLDLLFLTLPTWK